MRVDAEWPAAVVGQADQCRPLSAPTKSSVKAHYVEDDPVGRWSKMAPSWDQGHALGDVAVRDFSRPPDVGIERLDIAQRRLARGGVADMPAGVWREDDFSPSKLSRPVRGVELIAA